MKKLIIILGILVMTASIAYSFCSGPCSGGGGTWGSITGTLSSQSDLNSALAGKQAVFGNQSSNMVYAGPTSGADAAPTWRTLVPADIPNPTEYDIGTCTTAATVSAANGTRQKVTLTNAQTCALSFTQPAAGTKIIGLKIIQSSAGSFNGAVSGGLWPGATVPTITATSGAVDFISCYLDGTNAYCAAAQDFR